MREQFNQQSAVQSHRNQVGARHAAAARAHQERKLGQRLLGRRMRGQDPLSLFHRQLGAQLAAGIAHAVQRADQHQLVGFERDRGAGRHVLDLQVEGLAGGRKSKRRHQHQRVRLQRPHDRLGIDPAHHTGVLKVDPIDDADRPRQHEVAADHADLAVGHRRVGQALRERGFDVQADSAGGLLHAGERRRIGDPQAAREGGRKPLELQLRLHLRPGSMHQHQADAHCLQQRQVLHQGGQPSGLDQLAFERHHERAAAV